jgi:hypothetical protein
MDDVGTDLSYLGCAPMLCRPRFNSWPKWSRLLGFGALTVVASPSACSKGECADPLNPQPDLPLCEVSGQSGHGGQMNGAAGTLNIDNGGTPSAAGAFGNAGQNTAGIPASGGSNAAGGAGGMVTAGSGGNAPAGGTTNGGGGVGGTDAGGADSGEGGARNEGGAPNDGGAPSDGGGSDGGAGGDFTP